MAAGAGGGHDSPLIAPQHRSEFPLKGLLTVDQLKKLVHSMLLYYIYSITIPQGPHICIQVERLKLLYVRLRIYTAVIWANGIMKDSMFMQ